MFEQKECVTRNRCFLFIFFLLVALCLVSAIVEIVHQNDFVSTGNALSGSSSTPGYGILDSLQPGEWYEVPNSHMDAVDPCPVRDCSYSAVEGIYSVTDDWSGGAYDTKRDRLIVWGGGHGGYAGNEVYVFNIPTLTWVRLNNPSDPPGEDVAYAPDGNPTSRHTYDYIQYVPNIDRFCSFGGAAFYSSGQTGTSNTDCFNFDTLQWERKSVSPSTGIGATSAYDSSTGKIWQHGAGGGNALASWDPIADAWTLHGSIWTDGWVPYDHIGAVDPIHKQMIAVGVGEVLKWDLSDPNAAEIPTQYITTSGPQNVVDENAPGFVWDSARNVFIGWAGGSDIYTLDPVTYVWTKISSASTNTVTPTQPTQWGTYGRFRYIPSKHALVVVNGANQNVTLYKLPGSLGTGAPSGSSTNVTSSSSTTTSSSSTTSSSNVSTSNVTNMTNSSTTTSGSSTSPTTVYSNFVGSTPAMPSLQDEKDTYTSWGWTWAPSIEPDFSSDSGYSVSDPDIHGDTEGDDLWAYLWMYNRTGEQGYLDRAQEWARYFKDDYAQCVGGGYSSFCFDRDGYGADHVYGWGLIDWYLYTGDQAYLDAAVNIAQEVEALHQPGSDFGCLIDGACMHYGIRQIGRQLNLITRVAEVTGDQHWVDFRDQIITKIMDSPQWNDTYGMYFYGSWSTDQELGTGSYDSGYRLISPFEIGIFAEGMWQAYRVTGREDLKQRIIAMARFIDQNGLDDQTQYTGYRFGMVNGQKFHNSLGDPVYSTDLVNLLVMGYKLTGDQTLLDRAKYFFNRGTKGVYGSTTQRAASDDEVHHFIDTIFDSSSGNFYLGYNKGELQYTYLIFENGGSPSVGSIEQASVSPSVSSSTSSTSTNTTTSSSNTTTSSSTTTTSSSSSSGTSTGSSSSGGSSITSFSGGGGSTIVKSSTSIYRKLPLKTSIYTFAGIEPYSGGATLEDPTLEVGVKTIHVDVDTSVQSANIEVTRYSGKPEDVKTSKFGKVYQYLQINATDFNNSLKNALVTLNVEKDWFSQAGLKTDDVAIFKFDEAGDVWNELDTELSGEDDAYYYYSIQLKSFSYFAISEKTTLTEDQDAGTFDSQRGSFLQNIKNKNPIVFWIFIGLIILIVILGVVFAVKKRNERFVEQ